jgi:hypothetical protein
MIQGNMRKLFEINLQKHVLHHVPVCYQRIHVFYCKDSLDDICVDQMRVLKTTFAELTTQIKILSGSIKEFLLWLSIQIHLSKQIYLSAVTFRCKCDRMHVHVVFLYIIFKCRAAISNCFVKNILLYTVPGLTILYWS